MVTTNKCACTISSTNSDEKKLLLEWFADNKFYILNFKTNDIFEILEHSGDLILADKFVTPINIW